MLLLERKEEDTHGRVKMPRRDSPKQSVRPVSVPSSALDALQRTRARRGKAASGPWSSVCFQLLSDGDLQCASVSQANSGLSKCLDSKRSSWPADEVQCLISKH